MPLYDDEKGRSVFYALANKQKKQKPRRTIATGARKPKDWY